MIVIVILLLLLIFGFSYQSYANRRDQAKYPAPGVLIEVPHGACNPHLYCLGKGNATVILDAGQGDCSFDWYNVQSSTASFTRVCTYD